MTSPTDPEPDQGPCIHQNCILRVGQDADGHWLVQDSLGKLEGRFVSFATAMAFARSEQRSLPGASVIRAAHPIIPTVPFAPVQPWETAHLHRVAA